MPYWCLCMIRCNYLSMRTFSLSMMKMFLCKNKYYPEHCWVYREDSRTVKLLHHQSQHDRFTFLRNSLEHCRLICCVLKTGEMVAGWEGDLSHEDRFQALFGHSCCELTVLHKVVEYSLDGRVPILCFPLNEHKVQGVITRFWVEELGLCLDIAYIWPMTLGKLLHLLEPHMNRSWYKNINVSLRDLKVVWRRVSLSFYTIYTHVYYKILVPLRYTVINMEMEDIHKSKMYIYVQGFQ